MMNARNTRLGVCVAIGSAMLVVGYGGSQTVTLAFADADGRFGEFAHRAAASAAYADPLDIVTESPGLWPGSNRNSTSRCLKPR